MAGVQARCPGCGRTNRIPWSRLDAQARCGACKADMPPIGEALELDAEAFEAALVESSLPVVVDFWAPWCGPCRSMAPEFARAAARGAGRWLAVKLNTENNPQIGAKLGIRSIPTLAVFSGGREVARSSGARPAGQIAKFVADSLAGGARQPHAYR